MFFFFFFFKQKTAYEMRISDWSSDVCSSDLLPCAVDATTGKDQGDDAVATNVRINGQRLWDSLMEMAKIGATEKGGNCRLALTDLDREADRKSVVTGKSVSVRVDLGGGRRI